MHDEIPDTVWVLLSTDKGSQLRKARELQILDEALFIVRFGSLALPSRRELKGPALVFKDGNSLLLLLPLKLLLPLQLPL